MRLASWNIRGNNGIGQKRRGAVVEALEACAPDVIVLQEVAWKGDLHEDLMRLLSESGWQEVAYGGVVGSTTKPTGLPVSPGDNPCCE